MIYPYIPHWSGDNEPNHDDQNQASKRPHILINHIFLPKRIRDDFIQEKEPQRDIESVLGLLVKTMQNFGITLAPHLP